MNDALYKRPSSVRDDDLPGRIAAAHQGQIGLGHSFHLVALGAFGQILVKKKFTHKQLLAFTANMQTSSIGLEACSRAHFLGKALKQQGPRRQADGGAAREALREVQQERLRRRGSDRGGCRTQEHAFSSDQDGQQLDLQAMHRIRDRLVARRTAVINQIRALLLERGMVFAQKPAKLKAAMADVLEDADNALTPMMCNNGILWDEWKTVEQQVEELTDRLEQNATSDAGSCRIRQIPGIGPIVAAAIVAVVGNGAAFSKGRDFAPWLGLVPRQYSTGGKAKLLGISKRGNIYLRRVLIHGARAAAMRIKRDRFPIGVSMNALEARAPRNVLVVAMANKLARIAWAVLSSGEDYRPAVSIAAA